MTGLVLDAFNRLAKRVCGRGKGMTLAQITACHPLAEQVTKGCSDSEMAEHCREQNASGSEDSSG